MPTEEQLRQRIKGIIDELQAHNLEMQKDNMELQARHFESTFRKDNPAAPEEDVKAIVDQMRRLMTLTWTKCYGL
jgi:hypothetical protein